MRVKRSLSIGAPGVLAAGIFILLGTMNLDAYAQAEGPKRAPKPTATKRTEAKTKDAKAKGKTPPSRADFEERVRQARRKGNSVPEPTVKLKPGEVPAIKFDSTVYDFGRVRAGSPVKHDFTFTNTGNGTLEILKAKAGWGCTIAGQYDRIVKPGESGKIPVTVSTHRGGHLKKSVTVYTNVPDQNGRISLTIQGELWQPVDVTPPSANFGRLPPDAVKDAAAVRKLTIVNNTEAVAKLTKVECSNPAFHAELRPIEEGKRYELTVSVVSPLNKGANRAKVSISTGVKDMPTLSIPVTAQVMSEVDVSPNRLTLTAQRPASLQRRLMVRNNTSKPIKISDLKASDPSLGVAVKEVAPGKQFSITVDVPGDYHPAKDKAQITFKTDCPAAPEVTIPITEVNYGRRSPARLPRIQTKKPETRKGSPATATKATHAATKRPPSKTTKPEPAKPHGG